MLLAETLCHYNAFGDTDTFAAEHWENEIKNRKNKKNPAITTKKNPSTQNKAWMSDSYVTKPKKISTKF